MIRKYLNLHKLMDSGQWNGNGGYCCAILYDHGSTVAQRSMGIIDSPPSTNLESLPKLESRCVSVVGPFLHGETYFGLEFNRELRLWTYLVVLSNLVLS